MRTLRIVSLSSLNALVFAVLVCFHLAEPVRAEEQPYPKVLIEQIPANLVILNQTGTMNTASVSQKTDQTAGVANSVKALQNGRSNIFTVFQDGNENGVVISQNGTGNLAISGQFGVGLQAEITQSGNNHGVSINQWGRGDGRPVTVRQY